MTGGRAAPRPPRGSSDSGRALAARLWPGAWVRALGALAVVVLLWLGTVPNAWAEAGRPSGWRIDAATEQLELGRATLRFEPSVQAEAEALAELIPQWWVDIERALALDVDDELDIVFVDHAGRVAEATAMPRWVAGVAHPPSGRIMIARHGPDGAPTHLPSLLRHELAHVALHRAAGGEPLPRWFQEGVAESFEGGISLVRAQTLANAVFGPGVPDLQRWDGAFSGGVEHRRVSVAYASARDFVEYLRGVESGAALRQVLALVRRGDGFEPAFVAAYGRSLPALHLRWQDELRQRMIWFPLLAGGSLPFVLVVPLVVLAWVRRRRILRAGWRRLELEDALAYQPNPA